MERFEQNNWSLPELNSQLMRAESFASFSSIKNHPVPSSTYKLPEVQLNQNYKAPDFSLLSKFNLPTLSWETKQTPQIVKGRYEPRRNSSIPEFGQESHSQFFESGRNRGLESLDAHNANKIPAVNYQLDSKNAAGLFKPFGNSSVDSLSFHLSKKKIGMSVRFKI